MRKLIFLLVMVFVLAGCSARGTDRLSNDFLKKANEGSSVNKDSNKEEAEKIMQASIMADREEAYRKYCAWYLTYENGNILRGELYVTKGDNGVVIDEDHLYADIRTATESFNTYTGAVPFSTTSQGIKNISGGTYGSVVDVDAEFEDVLNMLHYNSVQEKRRPLFKKEMPDIKATYIEISLSEQKLYVYSEGLLVNESLCVTGMANTSNATPPGYYYISEKVDGKYLRGPGYVCWVNKWMRLTNSGIGLHDATWKSQFGGNIYTYDGSHGCINLPLDFAAWLFDNVYVNMPVIIH